RLISTRSCTVPTPSFFFQSYPYHPVLHSFPTRRSSDLTIQPVDPPVIVSTGYYPAPGNTGMPAGGQTAFGAILGTFTGQSAPARSEEHTSELQSRFDLVCRLLLEKKNIRRVEHDGRRVC